MSYPAFEELGTFYLGRLHDLETDETTDQLLLYDSQDLQTHAVIVGMTGSGKTGLGISLLEEAAIDRVPVLAIDPKGDLGNLLLTFPKLEPKDFEPWVDAREAQQAGQSVGEFARAQAALWTKGLGDWGQDGARIQKLRDSAEMALYTPGSNAGLPISVLGSFAVPPAEIRADAELFRERIEAVATGLLTLLGMSADPIADREHVLLSTILERTWSDNKSLDLATLIAAIQKPPVERIGVLDLESFYPAKDRFALAMRLNSLLAAPGFKSWLEGEPLDAKRLLYTDSGQPRVSVLSIAHLSETERMFFVTMLLNEVLSWVRTQPGTGSLRAVLYMDEIFGFLPPTQNPPSKRLFLTLLKQARAYGLGLVLATQNPVDLDYKALSNAGTWFVGRLQTERDRDRLLDGMMSLSRADSGLDRQSLNRSVARLGKRVFLLHNVHESGPVVFHTRWAMSYLAGPLTRDQIKRLVSAEDSPPQHAPARTADGVSEDASLSTEPAVLPPGVDACFLPLPPVARVHGRIVYEPALLGAARVGYTSSRYRLDEERQWTLLAPIPDGVVAVDWEQAEVLDLDLSELDDEATGRAEYAHLPPEATEAKNYKSWTAAFKRSLRTDRPLMLWKSPALKLQSQAGESEADFRIRLQQAASERRDTEAAKLRKKYDQRLATLEARLERAEHRIESERDQAKQKGLETVLAAGSAILGAFLGRKRISMTQASRIGSVARKAGRAKKEAGDVERARETAERAREEIRDLEAEFEAEISQLESGYDAQGEELTEIPIRPKAADIHVQVVSLAWVPRAEGVAMG